MEKDFYREYFRFENSHWWFRARERILVHLIDKYLPDDGSSRILDVGTGTGKVHDLLCKYGNVTGIEIRREAIAFCRERGISSVFQADAQNLPFRDSSFDFVSALDVIEHLEDDALAVSELSRVLCGGGVLLATVPAFKFLWSTHDVINRHKRRYSASQLADLFRAAGFSLEKLSYYNFLLFPLVAAARLSRSTFQADCGRAESDLKAYPAAVNRFLEELFALERLLLARWNLPFGVSIVCVARKSAAG